MGLFVKDITVNEAINRSRTEKNAVLLDIRPKEVYKRGHVDHSINIPRARLDLIKTRIPDQTTTLYVVGWAKDLPKHVVKELKKMGYTNAIACGLMEDHYGMLKKS